MADLSRGYPTTYGEVVIFTCNVTAGGALDPARWFPPSTAASSEKSNSFSLFDSETPIMSNVPIFVLPRLGLVP